MAGFIPAIHVFTLLPRELKTWMPATSAGMTARGTAVAIALTTASVVRA